MLLIAHNWWSLALRGFIAILVGIATFVWPGVTLTALVLVFGAYALIDGVLSLAGAWRRSQAHERWGALLIEGLVGVIAGVVTFAWPAITTVALITVIAIWAILTGVFEIAGAIRLRKHITGEWVLGLIGMASVLFGALLLAEPVAGALAIALWFGVYALISGVLMTVLAFRLRGWTRGIAPRMSSPLPSH